MLHPVVRISSCVFVVSSDDDYVMVFRRDQIMFLLLKTGRVVSHGGKANKSTIAKDNDKIS